MMMINKKTKNKTKKYNHKKLIKPIQLHNKKFIKKIISKNKENRKAHHRIQIKVNNSQIVWL